MIPQRSLCLVLSAIIALLLNSCFDVREEYWIREDGSVQAELSYEIPSKVAQSAGGSHGLQQKIDHALRDNKGIHRFNTQCSTDGERTRIRIHAEIANLRNLNELADNQLLGKIPPILTQLAGEVSTEILGLSIRIKRRISIPDAFPALLYIPKEQLEGHRMVYILHLPQAATHSNATDQWNGDKSLIWEIPLTEAARKPFTTEFQTALPIPWRPILAFAAGSGILIAGTIHLRRRRKRAQQPF